MASLLIESKLPKTAEYINSDVVSVDRAGHHNYVIEQQVCNLNTCLDDMTAEQINKFDKDMVVYLKFIDN